LIDNSVLVIDQICQKTEEMGKQMQLMFQIRKKSWEKVQIQLTGQGRFSDSQIDRA